MKKEPEEVIFDDILQKDFLYLQNENCSSLEGQVVKIADEIAQKTHDLEDGFRSGVIDYQDIEHVAIVEHSRMVGNLRKPRKRQDAIPMGLIVRNLIHILIVDLIEESKKLIKKWKQKHKIISSDDFYNTKQEMEKLIDFSDRNKGDSIKEKFGELSDIINRHIINSERVNRMDGRAKNFIKDLFIAYYDAPRQLPSYLLHRYENFYNRQYLRHVNYKEIKQVVEEFQSDKKFLRMICDHIAGMTDNFSLTEHQKLYLSSPTIKM